MLLQKASFITSACQNNNFYRSLTAHYKLTGSSKFKFHGTFYHSKTDSVIKKKKNYSENETTDYPGEKKSTTE